MRKRISTSAINVLELRLSLRMSQPQFAAQFGLCLTTLRQWEVGRRCPTLPARILLAVIARDPEIVKMVVREQAA